MKKSGARAFWLSFLLTLAILLPLLGSFVLYSGWQLGKQETAQQAQKNQTGVPLGKPTAQNDLTLLVVVTAEEPTFMLLRLDGLEGAISLCPVPAQSVLLGPGGTVLLQKSYASAGPARAAVLLGQTLNIRIDKYLALTPLTLGKLWGQLEPPRVNFTGLLEKSELEALGLSADPVMSLAPSEATAFVQGLQLPAMRKARLRAAVWEAALRQQLENLPQTLPAGLRKQSGSLLSDLTAADYYTLEETLGWLVKKQATLTAEPMPGRWDEHTQRYEFGEESVAFAKRVFVAAQPGESSGASLPYATPLPVGDLLAGQGAGGASPTPGQSPTPPPAGSLAEPGITPPAGGSPAPSPQQTALPQEAPAPAEGTPPPESPSPIPTLPLQPGAAAGSLE